MRLFRVYVDGNVFYHPNLSKLAITEAKVSEDAENIDSLTLSAPYNHPYIDSIKPMASVIVCKRERRLSLKEEHWMMAVIFITHIPGHASQHLPI